MSDTLSIRCVGDIMVDHDDPKSVVKNVIALTTAADVMAGNLEGLLCDVGVPVQKDATAGTDRVAPKNIAALTAAGFNAVGVANNCSMNFGWEGLNQMLGLLDDEGIRHAGGGANIIRAHEPAILEIRNLKCALLSYTSVYLREAFEAGEQRGGLATVQVDTYYENPLRHLEVPGLPATVRTVVSAEDRVRVEDDIRDARREADVVMIGWHWGISGGYGKVVPYQVELAHMAIDAGADIVFGHHPHQLEPLELYKGKVICYSLGNFTLPILGNSPRFAEQMARAGSTIGILKRSGRLDLLRESLILEVLAGRHGIESVRVHPIWIENYACPAPLSLDDARTTKVMERLGDVDNGSNVWFEPVAAGGYFEVLRSATSSE